METPKTEQQLFQQIEEYHRKYDTFYAEIDDISTKCPEDIKTNCGGLRLQNSFILMGKELKWLFYMHLSSSIKKQVEDCYRKHFHGTVH